jgi:hypothetical protein
VQIRRSYRRLRRVESSQRLRLPAPLAYPLSTGVGAVLATAPVVTLLTGQLSLVSPFATLTADFALPPLMITGILTVIAGAFGSSAAAIPGLLVWPSAWWLVTNAQLWSALPWAALDIGGISVVHVITYYVVLFLGVLALSYRRRIGAIGQRKPVPYVSLGIALLAILAVAVWSAALFMLLS